MRDFFASENLDKKLKLDLHTHCYEATSFSQATPQVAQKILDQIKQQGLDGIAVTEHWDRDYAFRLREVIYSNFNDDVLILPGREFARGLREEVVEIYLPEDKVFRFWVHPRSLMERSIQEVGDVQGIEVDNDMHKGELDTEKIKRYAQERGLLMLTNSDAHYLNRIGVKHNLVSMAELLSRAVPL